MFPGAPRLRLGSYEPLLELASGGMATVYVARQVGAGGFERLVVVKRVHPHLLVHAEFTDMFRDEGRVAATLHHPNVVPVTDVVEAEGELFLVMEYVESTSLASLLTACGTMKQKLPPAVVSRILHDTLAGLHAAHDTIDLRGNRLEIVHRDISPQNVVVGVDGSSRVIDFGVAKARHRLTETRSGSLKGKFGYMAPEQARGAPIDRRADLFAAGIVLWESLTGQRLFRGDNELDTMRRLTEQAIQLPSLLAPNVPSALDAVVLRALARDPEQRFQTASSFLEALEGAQPPAPTRDVSAVVKAYCGERLDARRSTLQAMLEGKVEPLSTVSTPRGPREPSTAPRRTEEGTEGQIAATRDASPPRRASSGRRLVVGGIVTLGLVAVAAVVALSASRHGAGVQPPVAASTAGVPTDQVAIDLVADSAIATVRTPGLLGSHIEANTAHLVVERWAGDLPIDVVLTDGRPAHVVAKSEGPRQLALVVASAQPSAAPAPSVAPASRPAPRAPLPAPQGNPELHRSPYGP